MQSRGTGYVSCGKVVLSIFQKVFLYGNQEEEY